MHAQVLALIAEPSKAFDIIPSPHETTAGGRFRQPTYRIKNPPTVASAEGDGQRTIAMDTAGLVLDGVGYRSPYSGLVSGTPVRRFAPAPTVG